MNARQSLTAAIGIAAVVLLFPVPRASAAVAGTKHDFTATGGYPITGVTEICKTCHVPHRPLMNVPLWAHSLSTFTYQLYNTNPTYIGPNTAAYDASPGSLTGSRTKICLSCHDGTVAVAGTSYIQTTSPDWIMWNNNAAVGGLASANPSDGLMGSHPIAVNYATVRTNQASEYKDISADTAVKLELSKVQCTSCHNPHMPVAGTKMLVKSNAGSALCITCHNK